MVTRDRRGEHDGPAAAASRSRSHWPVVAAVLFLSPVLYVLSEAPMIRLTGSRDPIPGLWRIYGPADWVSDRSLFSDVLLKWAGVWGVQDTVVNARTVRRHMRFMGKQPYYPIP